MKQSSKDFLSLFFEEGETICVSDGEFGYHSVSQNLDEKILLHSPSDKVKDRFITEDKICLMSMNPVNGFRRDEFVTGFRSFLVEMDDDSLEKQMKYIEEMDMPYSVCVFSGNKSLHFGIVLEEDLPTEEIWRDVAEWILNIMERADQKTKNPTRSIRFPNNIRPDGAKKEQKLLKMFGRVPNYRLSAWLNRFPEKNPAEIRKKQFVRPTSTIGGVPEWVLDKLIGGVDESKGRNNEWFIIAKELAKSGLQEEEIVTYLEEYFIPERDFSIREWKGALRSGYKSAIREFV